MTRLRKHVANTDVAIQILKRFYVRETDTWVLKVMWWNIGLCHTPYPLAITQRLKIPAAAMADWRPYTYRSEK